MLKPKDASEAVGIRIESGRPRKTTHETITRCVPAFLHAFLCMKKRKADVHTRFRFCRRHLVSPPLPIPNAPGSIQASKLDKLVATGRFGLGFNSVYHFTDLPSLVSGEHLVMFDPHTKYVPGATSVQPGIKVSLYLTGYHCDREYNHRLCCNINMKCLL